MVNVSVDGVAEVPVSMYTETDWNTNGKKY
jgi:hypothetical protein